MCSAIDEKPRRNTVKAEDLIAGATQEPIRERS
jgi:hypothetical protein